MIQTTLDRILIGPERTDAEHRHEDTQGDEGGGTTESQEGSESSEGESWGSSVARGGNGGQRGTRSSARLRGGATEGLTRQNRLGREATGYGTRRTRRAPCHQRSPSTHSSSENSSSSSCSCGEENRGCDAQQDITVIETHPDRAIWGIGLRDTG